MSWKKHLPIILLVFVVTALMMRPSGCRGQQATGRPADARLVEVRAPMPEGAEHLAPESFVIRAEVADTPEARRRGLAGRRALEPGYGMLYVYEEPSTPRFTGGGTGFALSVAFLRADGTIVAVQETRPGDTTQFEPTEPVLYALEARAGWFADRGLGVGARLVLPDELAARAGPTGRAGTSSSEETPAMMQPAPAITAESPAMQQR